MALSQSRCQGCAQPLADPPFVRVPVVCARCRSVETVEYSADGQAANFESQFSPRDLQVWFAAARVAMASGVLGVCVGRCSRCTSPLTISKNTPVVLPCPHCGVPSGGPADLALVDLWPEPWTKIELNDRGGSSEYRLTLLEDEHGIYAGCPHCGADTPTNLPHSNCPRCGSVIWIERHDPDGKPTSRFQLGVRVTNVASGASQTMLLPIGVGEKALADAIRIGVSAQSSAGFGRTIAMGFLIFFLVAFGLGAVVYLLAR